MIPTKSGVRWEAMSDIVERAQLAGDKAWKRTHDENVAANRNDPLGENAAAWQAERDVYCAEIKRLLQESAEDIRNFEKQFSEQDAAIERLTNLVRLREETCQRLNGCWTDAAADRDAARAENKRLRAVVREMLTIVYERLIDRDRALLTLLLGGKDGDLKPMTTEISGGTHYSDATIAFWAERLGVEVEGEE